VGTYESGSMNYEVGIKKEDFEIPNSAVTTGC
jgi:hypothetical protein